MIPKSSKFPTRQQFLQFRAIAHQLTTPHLRILTSPHPPSRLSIIIPIKVNKRATTRNYLRRLVYDNAWKILWDRNLDCVILFKPIALPRDKSSSDLLLSELQSLKFENLRI